MSFPSFKYNYPQFARESGFQLRNYKDGPLDWRLMGTVEIGDRDQCLEQLDSVLEHLSEAPLGSILESNILDSGISKYFLLSQFSIQYLLFCRKFLEEMLNDLRDSFSSAQMEIATLKRSLSEANNEILQLHKRITQMEAIHEVIFPCHLCTKNFVSNDALNLHISRKHNRAVANNNEGRDTPMASAKDKENDLTLINTIKLELEIKHLKERLNNAERKIKESSLITPPPQAPVSNRSDFEKPDTTSIGIQSNLSEVKEQDDQMEEDSARNKRNVEVLKAEQISGFQEKLVDLHRWQEEQKLQNSNFLSEINNKLKELANVMEIAKSQQQQQNLDQETVMSKSISMEDLISRKVEEIGQSTMAKLNNIVSKIEDDYKYRLEEMETQLLKIPPQKAALIPLSCENEPQNPSEKVSPQTHSSEESSSLSNHTFVKTTSDKLEKQKEQREDGEEQTDVSDDTIDDDDNRASNTKVVLANRNVLERKKPKIPPKPVTRKQTKIMVYSRLTDLGINYKTAYLNHSSMKHISHELSERRHKLKEKHPNFYATRNRIKKFVDKLCSSKMPEKGQALLSATRSNRKERIIKRQSTNFSHSSDEEEALVDSGRQVTSTPVNTEFKQRLESILASPIMKPEEEIASTTVHKAPIPMPRKKVMFNQPEMKLRGTINLSETESEHTFP